MHADRDVADDLSEIDHLIVNELRKVPGPVSARRLRDRVCQEQLRSGRPPIEISVFFSAFYDLQARGVLTTALHDVDLKDGEQVAAVCATLAPTMRGEVHAPSSPTAITEVMRSRGFGSFGAGSATTQRLADPALDDARRTSSSGRPGERGDTLTTTLIALLLGGLVCAASLFHFVPHADAYRPAKVSVDDAIRAARDVARGQGTALPSGATLFAYPSGSGFEIDVRVGRPAPGETLGAVVQRFVVADGVLTLPDGTRSFGEFIGQSGTLTQPQPWDGVSSPAAPIACDATHAVSLLLSASRVAPQPLNYGCDPQ